MAEKTLQLLRPHEHAREHMHLVAVLDKLQLSAENSFLIGLEIAATVLSMSFGGDENAVRRMMTAASEDMVTIFNNTAPLRQALREAAELDLDGDHTRAKLQQLIEDLNLPAEIVSKEEAPTPKRSTTPTFICPPSTEMH